MYQNQSAVCPLVGRFPEVLPFSHVCTALQMGCCAFMLGTSQLEEWSKLECWLVLAGEKGIWFWRHFSVGQCGEALGNVVGNRLKTHVLESLR